MLGHKFLDILNNMPIKNCHFNMHYGGELYKYLYI